MNRLVTSVMLMVSCVTMVGCAWTVRGLTPPQKPSPADLLVTFNRTTVNQSVSGDVLANVLYPDDQLIMQGHSTIGASGPRTPDNRMWLTMVSFGESLAASGKYFVYVDDKPTAFMYSKFTRARLDVEKVLSPDVLNAQYPDENARNIAILKDVLSGFNASAMEIKLLDTRSRSCAMVTDQLLNQLITRFKATPSEALHFECAEGIEFQHDTMGKGRFRMLIAGDVVKLKVIVGSASEDFLKMKDVQDM